MIKVTHWFIPVVNDLKYLRQIIVDVLTGQAVKGLLAALVLPTIIVCLYWVFHGHLTTVDVYEQMDTGGFKSGILRGTLALMIGGNLGIFFFQWCYCKKGKTDFNQQEKWIKCIMFCVSVLGMSIAV